MEQEVNFRELKQGTTLYNGKYIIERTIGVGGFGITYYAKHTSLNQHYAIKEFFISGYCERNTQHYTVSLAGIKPEMFAKYRQRFVEEAQTIVKLDHPNIVKVVDIFEENNTSYIVMPFVEGTRLQSKVEKNGKLSYELAVNYIAQVSEAVAYIHHHNILHRDIKPDNVMITNDDKVVLIDFGSAREFEHDKTQNQTSILTQGYAPIEQYSSNSRKGNYTDIYAIGAVFYFALTGQKPMDATSRLTETMKEPKELNSQIPEDANRTIMKAMQLKQENRHQTVEEFMKDLLGEVPSKAIKDTGFGHIKGKNKRPLYIAAGIFAIIFILIMIWLGKSCSGEKNQSLQKPSIEIIPGYKMVWVEGGNFIRGDCTASEEDDDNYTTNKDSIEISGFYMGIYEVSREMWKSIMGYDSSQFDKDFKNPVENVTYNEVKIFINKINDKYAHELEGKNFMLPTEAQWEYAAGSGNKVNRKSKYSGGRSLDDNIAWYSENSKNETHKVGSLQANRLGIFDMTGNVSEWCRDWYDKDFYKFSSHKDPVNTTTSDYGRVYRGGSYDDDENLEIYYRDYMNPEEYDPRIGFRLIVK